MRIPSIVVLLSSRLYVSSLTAAPHTELPILIEPAERTAGAAVADAEPVFAVQVHDGILSSRALKPGSHCLMELLPGQQLEAVVESSTEHSPDAFSLSGHVRDFEHSSFAVGFADGVVQLLVRLPTEGLVYRVRTLDGKLVVEDVSDSSFTCGESDEPTAGGESAQPTVNAGVSASDFADSGDVIDMLVVYTPHAEQVSGGQASLAASVNASVADTNEMFANSGIDVYLNLVGIEELPGPSLEACRHLDAYVWDWVEDPSDGRFDWVHVRRNLLSADVVLVLDSEHNAGQAHIAVQNGVGYPNLGFFVMRAPLLDGSAVLAHELGHILGSGHDDSPPNSSPLAFPYALGHVAWGAFHTIMAVSTDDALPWPPSLCSCGRIPYYSNPNLTFEGVPTGIPEAADNTRAMNQTRTIVANFRRSRDCNENGVLDSEEIAKCPAGTPACGDCNANGILDECEIVCVDADGCKGATGTFLNDCNSNGIPDDCDIGPLGSSEDLCEDGVPDECNTDCNQNGTLDDCDLRFRTSEDRNGNNLPDECEIGESGFEVDCDSDGRLDAWGDRYFEVEGRASCETDHDCASLAPGTSCVDGSCYLPMNRYISFKVLTEPGIDRAIRVDLDKLLNPIPPLSTETPNLKAFEGEQRWVNALRDENDRPVFDCPDSSGRTFKCATLGCNPEFYDWAETLEGEPLYVTSSDIIPDSHYTLRLFRPVGVAGVSQCDINLCSELLLHLGTGRWGDVAEPYWNPTNPTHIEPTVLDLAAEITGLKDIPDTLAKPRLQLNSINPLRENISVLDIAMGLNALREDKIRFSPQVCPKETETKWPEVLPSPTQTPSTKLR